jgi:hypothetical protein
MDKMLTITSPRLTAGGSGISGRAISAGSADELAAKAGEIVFGPVAMPEPRLAKVVQGAVAGLDTETKRDQTTERHW